MASGFQTLPGFRDFDPRSCMLRNYLFEVWRTVARRYGFSEYETPLLEPTELYLKKSGGELTTQLFRFQDQGKRDVTLRPEVTASLARLAAATQRDYPKPLKWFEIGQCFRYESPQKGRTREFYQFNTDLLGDPSPSADAELIALTIDTMRELGFHATDFKIRLSDRQVWQTFAESKGLNEAQLATLLSIIDKKDKIPGEKTSEALAAISLIPADLSELFENPNNASPRLTEILANLSQRGLAEFVEIDLSIVRGLAYYTGIVFEIFDTTRSLRAVAGGGRYDTLIATLTDGKTDLPAIGFAMGDVVIGHLIAEVTTAQMRFEAWKYRQATCDVYLIIPDESKRPELLQLAQELRDGGIRVDFPLGPTKFNKQFTAATQAGARYAAIIGEEYPEVRVKILSSRLEESIHPNTDKAQWFRHRLTQPDGPLLA